MIPIATLLLGPQVAYYETGIKLAWGNLPSSSLVLKPEVSNKNMSHKIKHIGTAQQMTSAHLNTLVFPAFLLEI